MFKPAAAILLIIAFIAQTFSVGLVMLNYYTNTAAFAKNCENKAKPKLHCNGKCQMMKKLKQEEKQDQQNPERKSENKIVVLSSKSFYCNSVDAIAVIFFKATPVEKFYPVTDISYSFFHPPQA
jgi:Zn-dependent membrane protease YugP